MDGLPVDEDRRPGDRGADRLDRLGLAERGDYGGSAFPVQLRLSDLPAVGVKLPGQVRLGEHEEVEVQVVLDEEPLSEGLHLLSRAEAADVREEDAKSVVGGWFSWFLELLLQMLQLWLLLLATLSL